MQCHSNETWFSQNQLIFFIVNYHWLCGIQVWFLLNFWWWTYSTFNNFHIVSPSMMKPPCCTPTHHGYRIIPWTPLRTLGLGKSKCDKTNKQATVLDIWWIYGWTKDIYGENILITIRYHTIFNKNVFHIFH